MNRPSARTNFPNRPSRRSRSGCLSSPLRLHRSRARRRPRSRSPTATSPETRTCPIRVPCHHAHQAQAQSKIVTCPSNRARYRARARYRFPGCQQMHPSLPSFTSVLPERPAFDQQRSKLDNEHDDENDSGTVAKARVAAFVHVCSPTATRFSPTPPSFSCSSSFSFSIPYRHQPRSADQITRKTSGIKTGALTPRN
jgi:hypothetical protein